MSRVVHFEIQADDMERAKAFYAAVFNWSYEECERRIVAAGGAVTLPKHALPGTAWQGYYQDTEGNTFGLHQPVPQHPGKAQPPPGSRPKPGARDRTAPTAQC